MVNKYQDQYGQTYQADAPMVRAPLIQAPQVRKSKKPGWDIPERWMDSYLRNIPAEFLMNQQRYYEDEQDTEDQGPSMDPYQQEATFDSYKSWFDANVNETKRQFSDTYNGDGTPERPGIKGAYDSFKGAAGQMIEDAPKAAKGMYDVAVKAVPYIFPEAAIARGAFELFNGRFGNNDKDTNGQGAGYDGEVFGISDANTQYYNTSEEAQAAGAYDFPDVTEESQAYPDDPYADMAHGGQVQRQPEELPQPTNPGQADDLQRNLSEGEFVIPANVVKYHGTKFFEGLIEKANTPKKGLLARPQEMAANEPKPPEQPKPAPVAQTPVPPRKRTILDEHKERTKNN